MFTSVQHEWFPNRRSFIGCKCKTCSTTRDESGAWHSPWTPIGRFGERNVHCVKPGVMWFSIAVRINIDASRRDCIVVVACCQKTVS